MFGREILAKASMDHVSFLFQVYFYFIYDYLYCTRISPGAKAYSI